MVPERRGLDKKKYSLQREQGMKSVVRLAGPHIFDWTRQPWSLTVWLYSFEVGYTPSLHTYGLKSWPQRWHSKILYHLEFLDFFMPVSLLYLLQITRWYRAQNEFL